MVVRRETVEERLKELDAILEELAKYRDKEAADLRSSLSLRWSIERGLIAAATVIFDVADHILSAHFGRYPDTYEDALRLLFENNVISENLFGKIQGLGGFRNILVHQYMKVDLEALTRNGRKAFKIFPMFSKEIQDWMDASEKVSTSGPSAGDW